MVLPEVFDSNSQQNAPFSSQHFEARRNLKLVANCSEESKMVKNNFQLDLRPLESKH